MKKFLQFCEYFLYGLFGFIWFISIYGILIPYLILLIGRNIDIFLFEYLLNTSYIWKFGIFSTLLTLFLSFVGLSLILWSFYTLIQYAHCYPFGIFPFNFFNPKKIAQNGPYSIVRHPMILGYLSLLLAFAIYRGSMTTLLWIIPIVGFVFYEYIKNREERRLLLWFGKEYEKYKEKTPLLIPNLDFKIKGK